MTTTDFDVNYFGELAWVSLMKRLQASEQGCLTLKVIAQFDKCVYVAPCDQYAETPVNSTGLICIGPGALGRGPLNVLTEPGFLKAMHKLCPDANGWVSASEFSFGPSIRLNFDDRVQKVSPGVAPCDASAARLLLNRHALPELPVGLDSALFAPIAGRSIAALSTWMMDALIQDRVELSAEVGAAIRQLIGLGAGLTPAGDDFLAGVLLTLLCIRRDDIAELLGAYIIEASRLESNRISAAHLHAAAHGYCGETLARVFAALAEADQHGLKRAIRDQIAVGHTSGRDTWCGVLFTLAQIR